MTQRTEGQPQCVFIIDAIPFASDGAEDPFDAYPPIVRYEQQLGIAIRKEILRRRGVLDAPAMRAPGPSITKTGHEDLTRLIERLDRKLALQG